MLLYLAEKSGQFLPAGGAQRWEVLKWLIWQVAGHGPMHGQAHHFLRYAPEGQDYGVTRYVRDVVRLLNVLEYLLAAPFSLGVCFYNIASFGIASFWVRLCLYLFFSLFLF